MQTPEQIIERARREFATSGAPWTERTAPSILNVVAPFIMDLQHRTLPSDVVLAIREVVSTLPESKNAMKTKILDSIGAMYDEQGQAI